MYSSPFPLHRGVVTAWKKISNHVKYTLAWTTSLRDPRTGKLTMLPFQVVICTAGIELNSLRLR